MLSVAMNFPDPIAGPRARLDRAKVHLDLLVGLVGDFLNHDPYTTTTRRDDERRRYIFEVHIRDSPPDLLPFIASDFIHNARAALDNIVWALAPASVRRRNPSFPLYDDPIRFQCDALPMLKGMKRNVIDAIEWCQPYHGDGHFVASERLLHLNHLWNFDKHRAPLAVGCVADMASLAIRHGDGDFPHLRVHMGTVLEEGKEIAWLPFDPALTTEPHPHFHFGMAFVGAGNRPIPYYGLMKMYDLITSEVVPAIQAAL